jgi:uncharacterized membrane protein YfcA
MTTLDAPLFISLLIGIAIIAFLYSSVGHAGASGYIAVMTLCGLAPATIRPIALLLNIIVAIITSIQFRRAGYFDWQLFWPFALLSIPAAALGGYVQLPAMPLRLLLGLVLFFSAARLFLRKADPPNISRPDFWSAASSGGIIGLLSGLTGTGGGIFLTPLLLFTHWARMREASAASAVFILVNSISGLLGYFAGKHQAPSFSLVFYFALAAAVGGSFGSYLGSRRFPVRVISLLLAAVLLIAGSKLIFTR